jgi:hypothetical protein
MQWSEKDLQIIQDAFHRFFEIRKPPTYPEIEKFKAHILHLEVVLVNR